MDSFEKYAEDVFAGYGDHLFSCVRESDLSEVKVDVAIYISFLDRVDNLRVYPLNQKSDFYAQAERGCCGSWNSQVKCRSGRFYWVGCNYGH